MSALPTPDVASGLTPPESDRLLFECAPVPMCELDLSPVRRRLDELAADSTGNLETWLASRPAEVRALVDAIRVVDVNHEFASALQLDTPDTVRRCLPDHLDTPCFATLARLAVALARGTTRIDAQIPARSRQGEPRNALLSLSVLPGAETRLDRVLASFIDITAREAALEALRKRDRLLGAVAQITRGFLTSASLDSGMSSALATLGAAAEADRAYVFRNHRSPETGRLCMGQIWEWSQGNVSREIANPELRSIPYESLTPDVHDTLAGRRAFHRLVAELDAQSRRLLEPQGILSLLLVPIHAHDEFWGYIGFDDCTRPRVWLEPEIAILQAAAASVGGAIERQQLEERLQHSHKMQAVGQLAGGIAHDFNNILTSILLDAGTLQHVPALDDEARSAVADIKAGAHRAAALTRQLLLFGHRSSLQNRALHINEVLEDVVRLLRRFLGEHIELHCELTPSPPPIHGDPGMIEQALVHLAANARDAMPRGGRLTLATDLVTLDPDRARAHPEARPGTFVRVTVADTGAGISKALLRRIFEPFFTTKDVGRGPGLGLSLVYSIVHQHGGWIEVDSEPGRGSAFRIHLPAPESPAAPRHDTPNPIPSPASAPVPTPVAVTSSFQPGPPVTPAPAPPRDRTVLLVEDEPSVRRTIGTFLRRRGYRVLEAPDGNAALAVWQQHAGEIDLLFTDMIMPEGLNGLELAARLRAFRPELPVIVASGYTPEYLADTGPVLDRVTHLSKPCLPADLLAAIGNALNPGSPTP